MKILKRTAKFEINEKDGQAPSNTVKLNIPKKTKLFVDQTMRERENAVCKYQKENTYCIIIYCHSS